MMEKKCHVVTLLHVGDKRHIYHDYAEDEIDSPDWYRKIGVWFYDYRLTFVSATGKSAYT